MKVMRTERHQINRCHPIWKVIDDLCFKSKNLYNYANYIVRQEFINNNKYINYYEMKKELKIHELYKDFGSQVSQQTLAILDRNWKSFFVISKDYYKHPNKYLGKPRIPKYKDKKGRSPVVLSNIQFKIENDFIRFSWKPLKQFNNTFRTNIKSKVLEIRFIPKGNNYIMEIVYEINVPECDKESKRIIGIDIGIDNFATISNNVGLQPFIVNGRIIKSMNQYYNKKKAELQSDLKKRHDMNWSNRLQNLTDKRTNKLNNYLHKSSKYIINWCILYNIDTIVIGKNDGWKQKSNLSKKVNQNFIQIPFNTLIKQIQYKAEDNGIKVILTEESYTSGTSFLDNDLPEKKFYDKNRRIKRGLFKSNNGTLINADLNGSYQIIKKVFPNVFTEGIEGVHLHPIRVNL